MFEADSQNSASAPSVPRGFTLQKFSARLRRGTIGGPWGEGGVPAKPPSPFRPPPPPLPIHPSGGGGPPDHPRPPLPPWTSPSLRCGQVFIKKLAQGAVMQMASRQVCDLYLRHLTIFQKVAVFYGTLNHFLTLYVADKSIMLYPAMWVLFAVAGISPNVLASHGSPIGVPWLIPLGALNMLPILVERQLEYTYISLTDIVFSIPFFSHQNRITSQYFALALTTHKGAYMASGRGLGHTRTSLVNIFLFHAVTNFLPGCQLLLLVVLWCALGGNALYMYWPMIAGVCPPAARARASARSAPTEGRCWRHCERGLPSQRRGNIRGPARSPAPACLSWATAHHLCHPLSRTGTELVAFE